MSVNEYFINLSRLEDYRLSKSGSKCECLKCTSCFTRCLRDTVLRKMSSKQFSDIVNRRLEEDTKIFSSIGIQDICGELPWELKKAVKNYFIEQKTQYGEICVIDMVDDIQQNMSDDDELNLKPRTIQRVRIFRDNDDDDEDYDDEDEYYEDYDVVYEEEEEDEDENEEDEDEDEDEDENEDENEDEDEARSASKKRKIEDKIHTMFQNLEYGVDENKDEKVNDNDNVDEIIKLMKKFNLTMRKLITGFYSFIEGKFVDKVQMIIFDNIPQDETHIISITEYSTLNLKSLSASIVVHNMKRKENVQDLIDNNDIPKELGYFLLTQMMSRFAVN